MALDLRGIACSAGSACQSGSVSSSHVLAAMGVPSALAGCALRLSVGTLNDDSMPSRVGDAIRTLVQKVRTTQPSVVGDEW
jgi:cysteine desulfurase